MKTLTADSPDWQRLTDWVVECQRVGTFASGYAESVAARPGLELTPEQVACLRAEFGRLTSEEVDVLFTAGVNPEAGTVEAERILGRVEGPCGVPGPDGQRR